MDHRCFYLFRYFCIFWPQYRKDCKLQVGISITSQVHWRQASKLSVTITRVLEMDFLGQPSLCFLSFAIVLYLVLQFNILQLVPVFCLIHFNFKAFNIVKINFKLFCLDTMVCTGCCATLDHIVTYLFKKVTNKGETITVF